MRSGRLIPGMQNQVQAVESHKAVLVIGIGNADRGDDGAGIATARHLRARNLPGILVVERSGESADLIDLWQTANAQTLYLIDATSSDLAPGTMQRFDARNTPLPAQFAADYSTHSFGLVAAIELSRALGSLPPEVIVYGIEGACFDLGVPLSAQVEAAALKTAEHILSELLSVA
jgi:hydrogenase maturation protease